MKLSKLYFGHFKTLVLLFVFLYTAHRKCTETRAVQRCVVHYEDCKVCAKNFLCIKDNFEGFLFLVLDHFQD